MAWHGPSWQWPPLRSVLRRLICVSCGLPSQRASAGSNADAAERSDEVSGELEQLCTSCAAGWPPRGASILRCGYVSLLFGDEYLEPALALGHSLQATGTRNTRILMHTDDVPAQHLLVLARVWDHLVPVDDIHSYDLDKTGKFRRIFTKLHCINSDLLRTHVGVSLDKVLFLDLDMLPLHNMDKLFDLRPPAAMHNDKSKEPKAKDHGTRLAAEETYINAGVMLLAPNHDFFLALRSDVERVDETWHYKTYCPEQTYLSNLLAGEITHISQLFNFEVTPHGGVPLTDLWQVVEADLVEAVHFSGNPKVWAIANEEPVVNGKWTLQNLEKMPRDVADLALRRQQ